MVFTPRLILGLTILYSVTGNLLRNGTTTTSPTTEQNGIIFKYNESQPIRKFNFTDKDIENIVKPFEFAKNENGTSIKLEKSESYDKSRLENARSIDIDDIISPDFHNAVYTINDELSTPKTTLFVDVLDNVSDNSTTNGTMLQQRNNETGSNAATDYINELNKDNALKFLLDNEVKKGEKLEEFPVENANYSVADTNLKETIDGDIINNKISTSENSTTTKYNYRTTEFPRITTVLPVTSTEISEKSTENYGKSTGSSGKSNDFDEKSTECPWKPTEPSRQITESLGKSSEFQGKTTEFPIKSTDIRENSDDYRGKSTEISRNFNENATESDFLREKIKQSENSTEFHEKSTGIPEKINEKSTEIPRKFPENPTESPSSENRKINEQIVQENQIVPLVQITKYQDPTTPQTLESEQAQQSTTVFIFVDPDAETENLTTTETLTTLYETTTTFSENYDDATTLDDYDLFGKTEIIASTPKGFTLETEKTTTNIDTTTTTTTTLNNIETTTSVKKTTTTTTEETLQFVHVKNVDNHTTLLPDVLKSKEIYTTPVLEQAATVSTSPRITDDSAITDETTSIANNSDLDNVNGSNGAIIAIIISCVGGVCLIVLAGLLIVMRNRQKRFNYGQRCRPVSLDDYSVDNVSVFSSVRRKNAARGSKRSYGNPAFEDPVFATHPLNFPAISKFATNSEEIDAEFHEIPQIIARTSELPEGCELKNRYANVIPLPESRVFLQPIQGYPHSDYINANYVTGPKNARKYYIACQAPLSNTVDDFWRMIWEQQCKLILMLTHLFENGVEKCFDYLPPSEVSDCHRLFGDFQVTLKKREVKEKYIISSIQLKNMVSNSWREVTHFWYMGWPEKGVPNEANSLIAFLIEARSFMKTTTLDIKRKATGPVENGSGETSNPVIVHCSPGTGRTGVVIACDIAIRDFEQTRQVDIPKILYKIRRDRASAVQTKEQYAFIYKVVDLYATKLAGGNLESI